MISKQFCPAKINLFLEVTGKRANGYHELATLFAKLTLGDNLTVDAAPAPQTHIQLNITGPLGDKLEADETNIAYKAAARFFDWGTNWRQMKPTSPIKRPRAFLSNLASRPIAK